MMASLDEIGATLTALHVHLVEIDNLLLAGATWELAKDIDSLPYRMLAEASDADLKRLQGRMDALVVMLPRGVA